MFNSEGALKGFWRNNKDKAEEMKNQLENYLGYICKHIYLSKNPIFLIFISDEFERYREKSTTIFLIQFTILLNIDLVKAINIPKYSS